MITTGVEPIEVSDVSEYVFSVRHVEINFIFGHSVGALHYYRFAIILYSHIRVEVTPYNDVECFLSDGEVPRYFIEQMLHFFVGVSDVGAYTFTL